METFCGIEIEDTFYFEYHLGQVNKKIIEKMIFIGKKSKYNLKFRLAKGSRKIIANTDVNLFIKPVNYNGCLSDFWKELDALHKVPKGFQLNEKFFKM